MRKNKKILYVLFFIFLIFILLNTKTFATSQYDLKNFSEDEKETAKTLMEFATTQMESKGYDIEELWYFVIYSDSYQKSDHRGVPSSNYGFDIYILNPSKNTKRLINGGGSGTGQNQFDYLWGATCFVGYSPHIWWDGLNSNSAINSLYGFNSNNNVYVIANNVTGTGCDFISNTYNETYNFFIQPPQKEIPKVEGVQVVEITQVEEIPKAIAETMKTIIPVGLLVLSIFLVIYLIRLVILRAI